MNQTEFIALLSTLETEHQEPLKTNMHIHSTVFNGNARAARHFQRQADLPHTGLTDSYWASFYVVLMLPLEQVLWPFQ